MAESEVRDGSQSQPFDTVGVDKLYSFRVTPILNVAKRLKIMSMR